MLVFRLIRGKEWDEDPIYDPDIYSKRPNMLSSSSEVNDGCLLFMMNFATIQKKLELSFKQVRVLMQ